MAGIAVNVLGHGHPTLVKAVCEQAGRLIHCSNLYYTEPQVLLIQKIAKLSGRFWGLFLGSSLGVLLKVVKTLKAEVFLRSVQYSLKDSIFL